jgi:hypothetical protein
MINLLLSENYAATYAVMVIWYKRRLILSSDAVACV